jgi:hypothetical protein
LDPARPRFPDLVVLAQGAGPRLEALAVVVCSDDVPAHQIAEEGDVAVDPLLQE